MDVSVALLFGNVSYLFLYIAVVVVDFATKGDFVVHTFDTAELLSNYTLFVVAFTNANGDPVELPNDGPSNGYNRTGTILDYIPNIAYSSLTFVEDLSPQCVYSKYEAEVNLAAAQVALISNETDLTSALANYVNHILSHSFSFLPLFLSTLWRLTTVGLRGQAVCMLQSWQWKVL